MKFFWKALTVVAAFIAVIACCLSAYFALVFRFGTPLTTGSSLTTDQMLACLTLVVTAVGVLVAVAAIGIGVVAFFGYGELRQGTHQKLQEHIVQILKTLHKSGDLDSATTQILMETLAPDRVIIFREGAESAHPIEASKAVVEEIPSQTGGIARPYPRKGDKDGDTSSTK
jgi:hypothetical protein